MHEYLKAAREGAAKKLKGIQSGEPHTKVDSSSWSPPEMLEADKQNGMRPVSKRQYKSGGKVQGVYAKKRVDRKARKEGGRAMSVDGFINRDDKMANDERAGVKKVGGMKRGGRTHKAMAGAVGDPRVAAAPLAGRLMRGARPMRPMVARPVGVTPAMAGKPMMKKGGHVHKKARGGPEGDYASRNEGADEVTQMINNMSRSEPMETSYAKAPKPMARPADKSNPYTGPGPKTNPNAGQKRGGKVRSHHAKGGAAHTDEVQDKKLMHKILKDKAFKSKGGSRSASMEDDADLIRGNLNASKQLDQMGVKSKYAPEGGYYEDAKKRFMPVLQDMSHESSGLKRGGKAMHHKDCSCKMCMGGRTKHASGGEAGRGLYVRQGYPHEVPGVDGGRVARKDGGRAKGKTNINIMIHPHGADGNMPGAMPPVMPPMGGPAMPPPPPPRPPVMPPQGMMPGAGMPMGAMPPMGAGRPGMPPIARKNGGNIPAGMHTQHVIDNAAGGGLGRLEKIKAYGLE